MAHTPPSPAPENTAAGASPSLIDSLIAVATSPWITPTLTLGWIALALAATQFPQQSAPLLTADGLTTTDWRALAAMGLTHIGDSLLLWLLAAVSLTVAVAQLLIGQQAVQRAAMSDRLVDNREADMLIAAVERAVVHALGRRALGHLAPVSSRSLRDGRRVRGGLARIGALVAIAGFAGWVLSVAWVARAPAATTLQVPVTAERVKGPVAATIAGEGRSVPAQGYFEAACSRAAQALVCDVDGLGESGSVSLRPGQAAALGPWTVTWTRSRAPVDGDRWNIRWWLKAGAAPPRWYSFDATSGRHITASKIGLSVTTHRTKRSGPIAIGVVNGGERAAVIAAGPGLLPAGAPRVRVATDGYVALLLSRRESHLAALLSSLVVLLGALLLFAVPSVEVNLRGGRVTVSGSNRAGLQEEIAHAVELARSEVTP